MIDTLDKADVKPYTGYVGPACILSDQAENGQYRVLINRKNEKHEAFNTLAYSTLAYCGKLKRGDTVLVTGDTIQNFFIIGILDSQEKQHNTAHCLETRNGAKALIAGQPDEEKLQFYSQHGELIFEYDVQTEKSRITVPSGDLDVRTDKGDLNLSSAQSMRFSAENLIEVQSSRAINMSVSDQNSETNSTVSIQTCGLDMKCPRYSLSARKGELEIDETEYKGIIVNVAVYSVKCMIKRFESASETVIENIKNVYRKVRGLTQLQTGRMRIIVDETYQLKSNKTLMKAEDDFKIKGEKIYLG